MIEPGNTVPLPMVITLLIYNHTVVCVVVKVTSHCRYTVIREGERLEVGTDEIVVGDVVDFKYGDAFPCDGLFIRGNDVTVSEASLTGESNNIKKNSKVNPFMYSGTQVGNNIHVHVARGSYTKSSH